MPDQARLILGQISLCTKQHSSQMPGRGAWAVLKLTVTLSTRGLAQKQKQKQLKTLQTALIARIHSSGGWQGKRELHRFYIGQIRTVNV